ncbi:Serine carboxypeptidase S28 family protein [Rhynchospora pubera]|uniref:Serine carboxypeptidase S28 family protein n=1 Tax=Rhynchospora pubera TaxID=906938 RepID=A0AAV8H436_9POAL|nr:Serine carboxypeptidase S28 family protein [Rhynchospora pubera]
MELHSSPSSFLVFILITLITVTNFITICSLPILPLVTPLQSSKQRDTKSNSKQSNKTLFTTHFFPQELDHFTFQPKSFNLFNQKYLMNSTYWNRGPGHHGPIFVYTGNEGNIEWFAENTGFMFDIAPKFGALLIFIEHRFYGESLPFGNNSYKDAESLGYLTSTQALADYAILIRSLKQNLSAEASPVVVFGGSYGGMLAAWFRLKYPHIAIGALSSSAPILQFDYITPWSSFYDAVSQDFKDESMNCFEVIKGSWDEIITKGSTKKGLWELSKTFKACQAVQSVWSFRDWLWSSYTYTAMVDYPMPANFLMPLPAFPIQEMCRRIDVFPKGSDKIDMVIAAANVYYNYTGDQKCFQIEHKSDPHGLGGWNWQSCTEMVMPMTITNESMFPPYNWTYDDDISSCNSTYGIKPRPHWITTEYGGLRIEQVLKRYASNIIFSNGMKDPWSRGGVLKNISSSIIALVTEKGAHHLDLRFATKEDPPWLTQQRNQEIAIIQGWIDQYYEDLKDVSS